MLCGDARPVIEKVLRTETEVAAAAQLGATLLTTSAGHARLRSTLFTHEDADV